MAVSMVVKRAELMGGYKVEKMAGRKVEKTAV